MAEFTWKIRQIEAMNAGSLSGVVVTVCFAVDGDENGLRGHAGSDVKLAPPDAASFTELSTVTEAQVIEWTKAALGADGVKNFEDMVQRQIDSLKVERPKAVPLPWGDGE